MKSTDANISNYEMQPDASGWSVTRRDFLRVSGSLAAGVCAGMPFIHAHAAGSSKPVISFGIVTDAHYADAAPKGVRQYKESVVKMTECVELMNEKKVDFLIELGDFKDQGQPSVEGDTLKYLETIEKTFAQFKGPRYHVLGNHDVDSISKKQFLERVENTGIAKDKNYYSFDAKGLHFVVLDANYSTDGSDYNHGKFDWTDANIPPVELDWLRKDLKSTDKPVVAFVHQRLDGEGSVYIKNAAKVRQVLQDSKRVMAMFQGHHHAGHCGTIEKIHYYTLKAMVEGVGEKNNSYAIVEVYDNHNIVVTGYHKAVSQKMV